MFCSNWFRCLSVQKGWAWHTSWWVVSVIITYDCGTCIRNGKTFVCAVQNWKIFNFHIFKQHLFIYIWEAGARHLTLKTWTVYRNCDLNGPYVNACRVVAFSHHREEVWPRRHRWWLMTARGRNDTQYNNHKWSSRSFIVVNERTTIIHHKPTVTTSHISTAVCW